MTDGCVGEERSGGDDERNDKGRNEWESAVD